jgi:hypothetical protein
MIPEYFHFNEDFLKVCPRADDIWISKLIQLTKTPVYVSAQSIRFVHEIIHDYGLSRDNTSKINVHCSKKYVLRLSLGKFTICARTISILKTPTATSSRVPDR